MIHEVEMKVIITAIAPVIIAVVVIFTMALARTASRRTSQEQKLEDADQREFLRKWYEQKCESDKVPDISANGIVHTVEPAEK